MIKTRSRRLATGVATTILSLTTLSSSSLGQPAAPLAATALGFTRAGIGGVKICVTKADDEPTLFTNFRYDPGTELLSGLTREGRWSSATVTSEELSELAQVVMSDVDGCVEVSIDPVADTTTAYVSPELQRAHTVSSALVRLDGNIATLLDGGIDSSAIGRAAMPQRVARTLLMRDQEYRNLASQYTAPPKTWHQTVFTVNPTRLDGDAPAVRIKVEPTPITLSPDGRRYYLAGVDATVAAKPYQTLVTRFQNNPKAFEAEVDSLQAGLRYARAFALLSACKRSAACEQWMPSLVTAQHAGAEPDFSEELAQVRRELRSLRLAAVWRQFRRGMDPGILTPEQRMGVYVDEAIATLGDPWRAAESATLSDLELVRLQGMIQGVDFKASQSREWVELANFIVGVWLGKPLDQIVPALDVALASRDPAVRYQGLRAAQRLLPVMRSNVVVSERLKLPVQPVRVSSHAVTSAKPGASLSPRAYLETMSNVLEQAITSHMRAEYKRLRELADGIAASAELSVYYGVLQEFDRSQLAIERWRVGSGVLRLEGDLNAAIADSAFAHERSIEGADRLRMVRSIARVAEQENDKVLALRLRSTAWRLEQKWRQTPLM